MVAAHKDVRETFIDTLRHALGRDAIADLNDRSGGKGGAKLETAMAIAKFRGGRGSYWQCASCGEVHEEATPLCATSTFRIRLEGPPVGNPPAPKEELRFVTDVEKVDGNGARLDNQTIFIDSRVAVREPGRRRQTHDPFGKVLAKGSCHGKRPSEPSAFIPAPNGSCFVLVLNASGIEGLDLGEATHLIKGIRRAACNSNPAVALSTRVLATRVVSPRPACLRPVCLDSRLISP